MAEKTFPILIEVIKYFPNHSHVYITATTGGVHAPGSYHYKGEAIDVGSGNQVYKDQLAEFLYPHYAHITELLHTKANYSGGWFVKNQVRKPFGWYGDTLQRAHINHVHLAVATLSQANALLAAVKGHATPAKPYVYPTGVPVFPGTLKLGSTGDNMRSLHRRLNILGYKPSLPESGAVFNNNTVHNVKAFQAHAHITQDGVVGKITWNKLWS